VEVANAFRQHFGICELYLADLDAIGGSGPSLLTYQDLQQGGFRLWVDAGAREPDDAERLAAAKVDSIVVGLETIRGPQELASIVQLVGASRVVFSLDLKEGAVLGEAAGWQQNDAWSIAAEAIALGVRRLILLDLARVGMGQGTGTEELCARLRAAFPDVSLAAGGGIRHVQDLQRLSAAGIDVALVASALHDGRLTAGDLAEFTT
jgi:phosphoribosylformimino-5-aminoimidazole carboxamide ribotide isomerase